MAKLKTDFHLNFTNFTGAIVIIVGIVYLFISKDALGSAGVMGVGAGLMLGRKLADDIGKTGDA